MDPIHDQMFLSQSLPEDGPDIDSLNDETFGSGAVDEDWEGCHDNYVGKQSRNGSIGNYSIPMNDDELERSNQQLAAAVEELVLNSDQDQDVIDPAIVSLRKESRGSSYSPRFTENLMSPYMNENGSFGRSDSPYSFSNSTSSVFQSDGMRDIWNNPGTDTHESYSKSPSMMMERQSLNEKLRNMMKKSTLNSGYEDAAILTAVKASPTPTKSNWQSDPHHDAYQSMFGQKSVVTKAEDLEKEYSKSDMRSPSPTFGISIPRKESADSERDRSLPARSISPVIGSPTSHALPIGTPPKHIADMMQQAQKQGYGTMPRPGGPNVPGMPHQRPRHGFPVQMMRGMPPRGMNVWPPGMVRAPMNPVLAQDLMNKLSMNKNISMMMMRPPPPNMSPIGSPRVMHSPRMGMGPMMMRPGIPMGMRAPMGMPPPFPNQRMQGPPFPRMHLGPGHLHPEHSRFVRMRRQLRGNQRRPHDGRNRRDDRNHFPRDPYSNLMTNREKEWVVKIQMMALQSDRPEIDDYYYQHYIEKKLKEGDLNPDKETSDQKRLITPTKANPDHKKYVPVQYDNSLGKLTVSSVYNPRQIIDVIHAEKDEDQSTESVDVSMSMSKRLEIYCVIEKSYSVLLRVEENQIPPSESVLDQHCEDKRARCAEDVRKLEKLLLPKDSTDTLVQCLRLRKGKRLLCRVLPFVSRNVSFQIVSVLIKQLPFLIKKDLKEQLLPEFYSPVCEAMCQFDTDAMVSVVSTLIPLSNTVYRDKFVLSLVCKVLTTTSKLFDLCEELVSETKKIWSNFLSICAKLFLSLLEKSKTSVPAQLEESVIDVLEEHAAKYLADDAKISAQLKAIRDLYLEKHS